MEDCIYCKIIKGESPCYKIAETENFFAILDIFPVHNGHALIIPKHHYIALLDLPKHLGNELLELAKKIGQATIKVMGADGFNFCLNNGKAAGQAVFHTHFHIIPRKHDDGKNDWPRLHEDKKEDLTELANKIKASIQ